MARKLTDKQKQLIKDELLPLIVADIAPLIERVLKKRLELWADEIIKNLEKQYD